MGCVRRWRGAFGVLYDAGLAVALGDNIDTLSSGLLINYNGRNGQKFLSFNR